MTKADKNKQTPIRKFLAGCLEIGSCLLSAAAMIAMLATVSYVVARAESLSDKQAITYIPYLIMVIIFGLLLFALQDFIERRRPPGKPPGWGQTILSGVLFASFFALPVFGMAYFVTLMRFAAPKYSPLINSGAILAVIAPVIAAFWIYLRPK